MKCKTLPCLLYLLKTAFNPFQKFICGSVHLDISFLPSPSHKPGEDRNIIQKIEFASEFCLSSWCNPPANLLSHSGLRLEPLGPQVLILFVIRMLWKHCLQIVGIDNAPNGRKVFFHVPGLLPSPPPTLHTISPGPQIPVSLCGTHFSGCWVKGPHV